MIKNKKKEADNPKRPAWKKENMMYLRFLLFQNMKKEIQSREAENNYYFLRHFS